MWIFISIVLFIILIISLKVNGRAAAVCLEVLERNKRTSERLDNLNIKLFGRNCADTNGAFPQVRDRINKTNEEISEVRKFAAKGIEDAKQFTAFATNELEKHLGIKYEKKIITTNGVEKDVSKYVRSGRRQ